MEYTFLDLWQKENKTHFTKRGVKEVYFHDRTYVLDLASIQLFISVNCKNPLCFLSKNIDDNEWTDNHLSLLLRKHLLKSTILGIELQKNDKVLVISFEKESFYGETSYYKLILELIPRYENLMLTREEKGEDIILDCHRRVHISDSAYRQLYPGISYTLPPAVEKPFIFAVSRDQFFELYPDTLTDTWNDFVTPFSNTPKFLKSFFKPGMKSEEMWEFVNIIRSTCERWSASNKLHYDPKGKYFNVFNCEDCLEMESVNSAFEYYYKNEIVQSQLHQTKEKILHELERKKKKLLKTLAQQKKDMTELEDASHWQKFGELIKINLHAIKEGIDEVEVIDYFESENPSVIIPLQADKSPQQNMEFYFKKYKKAVSGKEKLSRNITNNQKKITQLEKEISDIRSFEDVNSLKGFVEKKDTVPKDKTTLPFRRFTVSAEGRNWEILTGRSNKENDELTTHYAKPDDWFFHTRVYHGSHVIVKNPSKLDHLPEKVREVAAGIAAYYSKAKHSTKVPVDFTRVRYVTKPRKSAPGFVVYKNQKTVFVDPIDPRTLQS